MKRYAIESSDCDFKREVETKRPRSWLKSISAFANGIGGTLMFGISDDGIAVGLKTIKKDAEYVSRLIKERISPIPEFLLNVEITEDERNVLLVTVLNGGKMPFYYTGEWLPIYE